MFKYVFVSILIITMLSACQKKSDCINNECTVQAINFTSQKVIGTFDGTTIDTLDVGDTVSIYANYKSYVTFKSNEISYTIQVDDCFINFPIF